MAKIRANMANLTMHGEAESFIEAYRFPQELVEHVCKYPESVIIDPTSPDKGYLVLQMRRGDITVVVGLRDPENPMALFVYLNTPDGHINSSGSKKGAAGTGTKAPTSSRALLAWSAAQGCTNEWSPGSGHFKVYYGDEFISTVPGTPSDHRSIKNTYAQMKKKISAAKAREEIREDMEKTHGSKSK